MKNERWNKKNVSKYSWRGKSNLFWIWCRIAIALVEVANLSSCPVAGKLS